MALRGGSEDRHRQTSFAQSGFTFAISKDTTIRSRPLHRSHVLLRVREGARRDPMPLVRDEELIENDTGFATQHGFAHGLVARMNALMKAPSSALRSPVRSPLQHDEEAISAASSLV
jgi:hypothetical protein